MSGSNKRYFEGWQRQGTCRPYCGLILKQINIEQKQRNEIKQKSAQENWTYTNEKISDLMINVFRIVRMIDVSQWSFLVIGWKEADFSDPVPEDYGKNCMA